MLTKDQFIKTMNEVHRYSKWQDRAYEFINLDNVPDLSCEVTKLLAALMDAPHDDMIDYFCWELNFGSKWKKGCVTDDFGRDIPLETLDDLYNYFLEYIGTSCTYGHPYAYGDGRLLIDGWYKGIHYITVDNMWGPCTYIDLSGTKFESLTDEVMDCIDFCHGGISYLSHTGEHFDGATLTIGWDYCHECLNDYSNMMGTKGDHRWTLTELINDLKAAVDDLLRYAKKETNY